MKKKILSITKKDFEIKAFQSGGPGGQHQNRVNSGVRIIHKDSGAVGESRNYASQYQNKKAALKRLTNTTKFKFWINMRAHEISKGKTIKQEVEKMMSPDNLKIETKQNGKWIILS